MVLRGVLIHRQQLHRGKYSQFKRNSQMNNLKYMIFNYASVTDEMIEASSESNRNTLRHSVSGTDKVILKYDPSNGTPSVFESETTYTQDEILTTLGTSTWSKPFP